MIALWDVHQILSALVFVNANISFFLSSFFINTTLMNAVACKWPGAVKTNRSKRTRSLERWRRMCKVKQESSVELKRHCNPPLLQLSLCKVSEIWDFDVIVSDMINLCRKNGNAKVVFGPNFDVCKIN